MIKFFIFFLLITIGSHAETLTVFAAASLSDVLETAAQKFEANTSHRIRFNFASSSILARQIQEGAPADLFLSADEAKMDALEKLNLLQPKSRRNLVSNTLALIVKPSLSSNVLSPYGLTNYLIKKIALAETETVPAGIYAKHYLTSLKLWETLKPKIILTENVRAALSTVEMGNAEAAIVYMTDAFLSQKVRLAYQIPQNEGPAISYPIAILRKAPQSALAQDFFRFLTSTNTLGLFYHFGFLPSQKP